MAMQARRKHAADSTDHAKTTQEQTALLERLVALANVEPAESAVKMVQHTAEPVDEVVFETEIGGVQYRVVRSKTPVRAPVNLSPRELAIAELITKGLPNKCIGDILDISPWTVATHLRRIFVKLNVTSRAAMVARLKEEHLL